MHFYYLLFYTFSIIDVLAIIFFFFKKNFFSNKFKLINEKSIEILFQLVLSLSFLFFYEMLDISVNFYSLKFR